MMKRAHTLRALRRADSRMLWRHGVVPVYLLLMLMYIAVLRFLVPDAQRPIATALLLLTDPATLSLFFMGAIVLHEKSQHIHAAMYVSGLKAGRYVFSKCLVMTCLGLWVGCAVLWFSDTAVLPADTAFAWQSLLTGDLTALCVTAGMLVLAGILFTCLSLLLAVAAKSLNGFLLLGVLAQIVFLVPAAVDLFYPLPAWTAYHPVLWLTRALRQPMHVPGWLLQPVEWGHAFAALSLIILMIFAARAAVGRMLRAGGRDEA